MSLEEIRDFLWYLQTDAERLKYASIKADSFASRFEVIKDLEILILKINLKYEEIKLECPLVLGESQ